MYLDHQDDYIMIKCNNINAFNLLLSFLNENSFHFPNMIINMLDIDISEKMVVSNLLPFYLNWQKRNKSFILVSNFRKTSIVDIVSIQSLEEAIDFFHMEDLTRNI